VFIRRLEIQNFRGVRSLDWRHIPDSSALIGPGDSGKSTILEAIERLLSPRWNLSFDDADFWGMNTEVPITVRATLVDLPNEFFRDNKFGLLLNGFNPAESIACEPTGADDEIYALVIELKVDDSLEPRWSVVDPLSQRTPLTARDREAFGMLRIGAQVDQHLGWSRGSALSRITDDGSGISAVLAHAARQARAGLQSNNLTTLSDTAARVQKVAKDLGVATKAPLVPRLDASTMSMAAAALSLHDGEIPTRRSGMGTRRLLALAMQREAATSNRVTLVDEFETGLEPHRIRRLLRALRTTTPDTKAVQSGQLFITSHSPTVVAELDPTEVSVVRRTEPGDVSVSCLPKSIEYVVKRNPHALLVPKVIVAEGITEVGLCYALDEAWCEDVESFGYLGVSVIDGGGGTQPAETAGHLSRLGYRVALLIDSDANAKKSRAHTAEVIEWPGTMCTEQRLSLDLPIEALVSMVEWATERHGRRVRDTLADALRMSRDSLDENAPLAWLPHVEEGSFREGFGLSAKKKEWFKSLSGGGFLGQLVSAHWGALTGTPTAQCVSSLRHFSRS
jgi:energy-coupling factor transporter ATP-binding protein EcfA2